MMTFSIAIAPVVIIFFYIYSKDRYDKEPMGLIIKIMIFGALACIPAGAVELLLEDMLLGHLPGIVGVFMYSFFGIALVEELFKYFVVKQFVFKNPHFNEPFDGFIYAVAASLGFAAFENIFYVFSGGFGIGVLRAFTAVPMHAVLGVYMGYYIGKAKFDTENPQRLLGKAILIPVIFHGLYDFFALAVGYGGLLFLVLLVFLLIGLVIGAMKLIKREVKAKEIVYFTKNDQLLDED